MTPRLNFPGGTLFNWAGRGEDRGDRKEEREESKAETGGLRAEVKEKDEHPTSNIQHRMKE